MKKTLILAGAFLLTLAFSTTSNAQGAVECVGRLEQFFSSGKDTGKPVVLNKLGRSPQFGKIKNHTASSAFAHLKNASKRSKTHGAEIDRLLNALGYSGINDPRFTVNSITPEIVSAGTTGWMGAAGNKYIKATFGRDFEGFKIASADGPCYVFIMKTCGNIFHPPFPDCGTAQPCPDCNSFSAWSNVNKVNAFCSCTPCPECQDTAIQTINVSGNSKIASGNQVVETKEVNLIASFGGKDLCMGSISVPVKVNYEYEASGTTSASEKVNIDNQKGNAISKIDLKIPVNLDFKVEDSQSSFGNNGAIRMDVTAKRFAVLKKIYKVCSTNMTVNELSGLSATEIDKASTAVNNLTGDGKMNLKKQTLFFAGNDAVSEVISKEHSNLVTVIAHSKKSGKLAKGESADRTLCLGQYSVAGASALKYMLMGNSTLTQVVEICDKDGSQPADKNINLPINLKAGFTKQEMKVGDDGKVIIEITEAQYKKMGKRFSKCCTNGDEGCW